jgi:hypothetical protein
METAIEIKEPTMTGLDHIALLSSDGIMMIWK